MERHPLRGVVRVAALTVPGVGWLARGRILEGLGLSSALGLLLLGATLVPRRLFGEAARDGWDGWLALVVVVAGLISVYVAAWRHLQSLERPLRRTPTAAAWRGLQRNRLAVAGLWCVGLLYLAMLMAPLLAPFEPQAQNDVVNNALQPPSWTHLLGTDRYARDMLSRLIYGARISLTIGFLAAGIACTLGAVLGAVAGYAGRWIDGVLMRIVDMFMAFPRLVLLLVLLALIEHRSIVLVVLVLGLTGWMEVARLVRGQVLSLKEQEFVLAARALGLGNARIVLRHLLPNAIAPVLISATLMVGNTILIEAGLSFLGLGVPPPTATWGAMVDEGRNYLMSAPWITTAPGIAIVVAVVGINLVGDGLRDALDPRSRK